MKEIPAFYFEKLQDEERISALMLLEKAKKAEEMWLDALENLLPVKAKIRYLVDYIDKTRGYKSLNLLDRIQKKDIMGKKDVIIWRYALMKIKKW